MADRPLSVIVAPSVYIATALSVILLPLRWIVAWLCAVIVHEAGHLAASLLCGASIRRICITPAGAVMETDGLTPGKQLIASVAGPAAGMCLMLLSRWIPVTATLAFIHALLNLLPIMNMDGSVILRSALLLGCNANKTDRICQIADGASRIGLVCICLIAAWKLSWAFAGIVAVPLLIRTKRNPCKQGILKVQ